MVKLLEQADALRRQRTEADSLTTRILPALFRTMFGIRSGTRTDGNPSRSGIHVQLEEGGRAPCVKRVKPCQASGKSSHLVQSRQKLRLPDLIVPFRFQDDSELNPLYLWRLLTETNMKERLTELKQQARALGLTEMALVKWPSLTYLHL